MMSVKEYAEDVSKKTKDIIKLCKELNINVSAEEDLLSEDNIIELDNNITDEFEEEEVLNEKAEALVGDLGIEESTVKVEKITTKKDISNKKKYNKEDFAKKRKDMYKNKEKLQSNINKIESNIVLYEENMSVKDFANVLGVSASELIAKLMSLGIMANVNNAIDFDSAEIITLEYKKELKKAETRDVSNFEEFEIIDDRENLEERPPVITIMGHVDHGKTTLLDTIRKADVASGEAGGITQHIGTYQITHNDRKLTFIDTPGHAAFTEMRARGAKVTDIIIIIVAADDGVMPQTKEAIDHAKAADVPIIVAINKIDKKGVNLDKVLEDISAAGLTPESWGGDTIVNNISALDGTGVEELLENIKLLADMQELKANPKKYASGTVIEACLDKNVGASVTILIQNGTLRLGDPIVAGTTYGKIRSMKNDLGEEVIKALPSTPVVITGLNNCPMAGAKFMAFEDEKKARSIGEKRREKAKLEANKPKTATTLEDMFKDVTSGIKEIKIIVKADVNGSAGAVKNALEQLQIEDVKVKVIRSTVGTISESDIVLASASKAIIVGFNVRPNAKTMAFAKEKDVDIRLHNIIYKVTEEIEAAMTGMLDPEFEEKIMGEAEVRKIFKFSKVGIIAGSYVNEGVIKSNGKARIMRNGVVVYDGEIGSVQREKETVKEVKKGFECGITIANYNDLKEGDVIEVYEVVEVKR